MPPLARWTLPIAALLLCAVDSGWLGAAERYQWWLDDGTRLSGQAAPTWSSPGVGYRFEEVDQLQSSNPVRLIRDRQAAVSLSAPYLVLANGDVLPGSPTALDSAEGRVGLVARVHVQLESPLMPIGGTGVAVRTDRVRRIVGSTEAESAEPPPGTVILADGRRLVARSIRWREAGLAVLTEAGIVEAAFAELVDVVFPGVDRTAAVLDDNLWASGSEGAVIARFQMKGGAVITASRISREVERSRSRRRPTSEAYYYAQPSWSDDPIALPEPQVAWCGYRAANEAPLSLLPSATLANRRLVGGPDSWLANRSAAGGLLASDDRESDLGLVTHSHSEVAFDLPVAARTLALTVGLDRELGGGGCVRCKVVADKADGQVLWDSEIFQSSDGLQETGELNVAGLVRVILVTEFAHAGRPAGADPLDIRDRVCWLAPLVRLDLSGSGAAERVLAILAGVGDWQLAGDGWRDLQLSSRWTATSLGWEPIVSLPRGAELRFARQFRVSPAADIVELLTACPADLAEHDFTLKVNGQELAYQNNANRATLRNWVSKYGRQRSREEDHSPLTDRLAYWWDLHEFRGKEVALELILRGEQDRNEIAWRSLAVRSAVAGAPVDGQVLQPEVLLTSLTPLPAATERGRGGAMKNAIPAPGVRGGETIRFLGQPFTDGFGLLRDSSIAFEISPEFREFVAVVGCSYEVVGPLQVLIDDRVVWERAVLTSLSAAEQLQIPIPAGSKKLTLRIGPDGLYYGYGAWANAGFRK